LKHVILLPIVPKGTKSSESTEKSTWWVGSNDDHQVIPKSCKESPQDNENPPSLSQDPCQNSTEKPEKEPSSLQDSNKGIQIQQSPQPPSSRPDQIDVDEALDQENQEHSDQEIPGNIDSTNGPTSTNEVWMIVEKKKKVHETPQPMVT
jgi:hypothetical protein